jgi:hypothetical protein
MVTPIKPNPSVSVTDKDGKPQRDWINYWSDTGQAVTDIEADIAAIEADITAIEADITTIEGDITTIEGDITTIEGDITAIEADIAALVPPFTTGLIGNNSTANDSALTAALAAEPYADRKSIRFGPGVFYFADNITITINDEQSIAFEGCGIGVTEIKFANNKGFVINYENAALAGPVATFRDMAITTLGVGTSTAVKLLAAGTVQADIAPTALTNVWFHGYGNSGPVSSSGTHWSIGVEIKHVQNVNFNGVNFLGALNESNGSGYTTAGTGVKIYSDEGEYSTTYNFVNCTWFYIGLGISYGEGVQGVALTNCNFVGGQYGIRVLTGSAGTNLLQINNSHFNCAGIGVYCEIVPASIHISGCFFVIPTSSDYGVLLQDTSVGAAAYAMITGNWFFGQTTSSTFGVVATDVSGVNIIGNIFSGLAAGVAITDDSDEVMCAHNQYFSCTADLSNTATGTNIWRGLKCTTANTTSIASP